TIMNDLGTLGGTSSFGFGLSNDGQSVGYSYISNGSLNAYVWNDTDGMLNLNDLIDTNDPLYGSFLLTIASGISDNGNFITGLGIIGGENHAFLLEATAVSTVPLPASLPLFLSGMAGIGLLRRRKHKAQSRAG
ncbi:MAG TPA: VPLPA-CTERM sorting domain-containing protein, partial [Rhodospirillales bacterium]|nr:VPLPA-CTERM sorting domain-containing protein [Rhodospirillales bacterium]